MKPDLPLIGPPDRVDDKLLGILGSAIGFGIALIIASLWCALPALCRWASAARDALL